MNFQLLVITLVLLSGFVGSAFAQEKITIDRASKEYGVVIDLELMKLDQAATQVLREKLKSELFSSSDK